MLDVDERRDDLYDGDGERDALAALGDSERCASDGVDARELALLKGSDLARKRLRLRAACVSSALMRVAAIRTAIRRTQGVNLASSFRRLEAGLARRRREINVDFGRRHGIRLAEVGARPVSHGWKRLLGLAREQSEALLVELRGDGGAESKARRRKRRQRLLLRSQLRRDVRAVPRTDVRLVFVERELAELQHVLEECGVLLGVEQRRRVVFDVY